MSTEEAKENTDPTQGLWRIAETDDIDQLELLLASGADINASNANGMTALMRAAARGRIRMVRALLKHGADLNASRNDSFTALMLAAFFGHKEIVTILVEHGAQADAATRFGTSAQMWATSRTFNDVAKYLGDPLNPGSDEESAVKTSKVDVATVRETMFPNSDHKVTPGTAGIASESFLKKARDLVGLNSAVQSGNELPDVRRAFLSSDDLPWVQELVQSGDDLTGVQEPGQSHDDLTGVQYLFPSSDDAAEQQEDSVSTPWLLLRLRPLSRSVVVYALAILLLAFADLRNRQSVKEVISKVAPSVAITSEPRFRPPVETINIGPSETQWLAADSEARIQSNNQTQSSDQTQSNDQNKPAISETTRNVLSVVSTAAATRRNRYETPTGVTNVSPDPIPVSTVEEVRSTEAPAAVASTAKPQQAVSVDPPPMKRPAPPVTQLMTGSKSSPPVGKVIQWP